MEFAEVVVVPLTVASQVQIGCQHGQWFVAGGVHDFYEASAVLRVSQQRVLCFGDVCVN
jgi:hypothetical protein